VGTARYSTYGRLGFIFPLTIAFVSLVATVWGARLVASRDKAQVRARTDAEARHVAAQLTVGLRQAFEPLQRIGAWWILQGRPLAPEDWENDAKLFVNSGARLQRVVWLDAKKGRSWIVRPGSEPSLATVKTRDPALLSALNAAQATRTMAVSPVFDFEGKAMVYACTPVLKGSQPAGFIAGLYDAEQLIRSLMQHQLPDQYTIVVTAGGREFRVPPARASRAPAEFQLSKPVPIANAMWSVTVAPSEIGPSTLQQSVMSFGVLASALLFICAVIARTSRRRAAALEAVNARLVFENQERRRAEERAAGLNRELQQKLEEFQTLLEVLPIGIAVAEDPECRRIWTNRTLADMLHLPVNQNISQSVPDPERPHYRTLRNGVDVPPDDLPMQVAARTGMPVANDFLDIVRSDGTVIHTLSYCAPLFDENGKVRGIIDACVDITQRQLLEDRLQQAEKYQSLALMAGGIAHDFNNLLTVIIGNAACIAADVPGKTAVGRSVADLRVAADRAAQLVSQLLAFTGRFWCEVQPLALSAEISRLMPHIREMVPQSIAIRYDLDANLPSVQAGAAELQHVLDALISNAVDAMDGKPGTIEIRTSRLQLSQREIQVLYPDWQLAPGSYVRLEIADTGHGIPDEILNRIFDPFFTTKFVGRGLGLSAVQGILRAHRGAIRLDSTLNSGTRVELILPEQAAAAPAIPQIRIPA
jgi:signal transduction histidine kinase